MTNGSRSRLHFRVAVSTAVKWAQRFRATGSMAPGRIGGYRPKGIRCEHRDWLLERCRVRDFTLRGLILVVDCRGAQCGGERSYAITALGACYGERVTVADVLRQMRCARGCGDRPQAAWLVTGAVLNERIRRRRVTLIGPEARE
jgi:hypothetical protein